MTQRFCLVTGAGRDIGRATAEALSGPGVHTLLHHAASAAGAREALAAIRAAGGDGTLIHADFADPEAIQRCAATIRQILGDGHLHTVVHNAAIAAATPLTDDVAGVAQAMLNVNVLAP
ncbi:MAG: SDR family oxidoreductase, partial [Acidobacteriota bacterium]